MRIITCTIKNTGNGDLSWVADHLDHGVWSDGKAPTERANVIAPGREGMFESRDGGDIPIIGSIATGTEGWVLYRTFWSEFVGSNSEVFIRISWNIPFLMFDQPTDAFDVQVSRYDPRQTMGAAEFNERDPTKPPPPKPGVFVAGPGGGDFLSDTVPWVLVPALWPMVLTGSKLGINTTITVPYSAPPTATTIPIGTPRTGKKTLKPMVNSTPDSWEGSWSAEGVSARIGKMAGGSLRVTVDEPMGHFEYEGIRINRILLRKMLTEPGGTISAAGGTRQARRREEGAGAARQRISRIAILNDRFSFRRAAEDGSLTVVSPKKMISAASRFVLEAEEGVGLAEARTKPVATRVFDNIVSSSVESLTRLADGRHQLDGDYLSLPHDATLEIYLVRQAGQDVDVRLRYRRPGLIASAIAGGNIDKILEYHPDVH
ncbi:hypothetical protein ABK249_22825 [Neorhizobium sp. Rsf11]|uniref:Minor tail protein n=1 Tax=Neorhizobium phenanthreniclasticum TaxID=3157917 RepID=A0ABV0M7A1_9HYPH